MLIQYPNIFVSMECHLSVLNLIRGYRKGCALVQFKKGVHEKGGSRGPRDPPPGYDRESLSNMRVGDHRRPVILVQSFTAPPPFNLRVPCDVRYSHDEHRPRQAGLPVVPQLWRSGLPRRRRRHLGLLRSGQLHAHVAGGTAVVVRRPAGRVPRAGDTDHEPRRLLR